MPTAIKRDKIDLSSVKKTKEFAIKFLKKIKPGNFIYLHGEIGVGKTTFVRYLINEFQKINKLEITEVTSPTFNLLNEYQINEIKINHYDLFRLKSAEEIKNLGLFEEIENTITLIEWPQMIEEHPKDLIELVFKYGKNHETRSVKIRGIDL